MSTSAERSLGYRTSSPATRASLLRRKVQRKLDQARTQGLGAVLRKAFADHIYRTDEWVILERPLELSQAGTAALERGDVIVVEPDAPLPDLSRHFSASQAKTAEAVIRSGCIGFFFLKDGDVIGYAFAACKDYFDAPNNMWFHVGAGEVYMFAWLVAPDQRSFTVASRIEKASVAYLAARGYRKSYCAVVSTNLSSLGTLLFLGYQETGKLMRVRRFLRRLRSTNETYEKPRYARYQRKRSARR